MKFVFNVTWLFPFPPPPPGSFFLLGSSSKVLPPVYEAPDPRKGWSSLRRSRSLRNLEGSDGRWWWLVPGVWSGEGPGGLVRSHWWRWCGTPWVHSYTCYCHFELSFWSPEQVSFYSMTSWFQLGPKEHWENQWTVIYLTLVMLLLTRPDINIQPRNKLTDHSNFSIQMSISRCIVHMKLSYRIEVIP